MSSSSNNGGVTSTKNIDAVVSALIDLLAGKSAERVISTVREDLKSLVEQVAKTFDYIGKVERELMDFKLNMMKEILVIREQLKTITESLVNIDRRFAALPKVEEQAIRGEEWEVSETETQIAQEEAAGQRESRISTEEIQSREETVSQREAISVKEEKPSFVTEKQKLIQVEKVAEKEEVGKQPIAAVEDLEKAREIAQLKTRLVRLQLEISSLQSLIDVGLGGVEEKEALNAKLREKKEIEERLEKLTKKV